MEEGVLRDMSQKVQEIAERLKQQKKPSVWNEKTETSMVVSRHMQQ